MPWEPLPNGEGPPRPPTRVRASLDRLLASWGAPAIGQLEAVFGRWTDVVGATVAAHARPSSLTGGVLVVVVDEPAWASELRWLEADLLARLRDVAPAVERLDVRVDRAPTGRRSGRPAW